MALVGMCRKAMGALMGAGLLIVASLAMAAPLEPPADKPMLVVSGKIGVTNKDGAAAFDRDMLEHLGMVTVETATPWYQGAQRFEGVPLAKLMDVVKASGEKLVVVALNDYSAELPIEDVKAHNVIIALKRNGEYMPVRDKGPLFVIYPFDSNPELKSQKFYSRSVWQVARIEVK